MHTASFQVMVRGSAAESFDRRSNWGAFEGIRSAVKIQKVKLGLKFNTECEKRSSITPFVHLCASLAVTIIQDTSSAVFDSIATGRALVDQRLFLHTRTHSIYAHTHTALGCRDSQREHDWRCPFFVNM